MVVNYIFSPYKLTVVAFLGYFQSTSCNYYEAHDCC